MDNTVDKPMYQRILLKLSGEALQGGNACGISTDKVTCISEEIASVVRLGVQVGLVIGGGNLVRGADFCGNSLDRVTADQMGMLATVINGLALLDAIGRQGIAATIMSAIAIPGLVEFYDYRKAKKKLQKGNVVIFVAGTGNPLVTTDTAAALRGIEVEADIVIKATKVDGVFASDPVKNPKAERYEVLTYNAVLEQRLGVMDLNAILLCREHDLPVRVCNMNQQGTLQRIIAGEPIGTLIQSGE